MWAATTMAATTLLVHASQIGRWPFAFCARTCLAAAVMLAGGMIWRLRIVLSRVRPAWDRKTLATLAVVAATAGLLSLISHHPNEDDYFYLGNAVYALEHPQAPLGFQIHFVYPGRDEPLFRSLLLDTSGAYEYGAAILAYWSGLNILTVYYSVLVVGNTCLFTAALFYLLTRFRELEPSSCAVGLATAFAALTLLAPSDRSPGNFGITHFFHGKAVLLTVWTPLFAAVSMDFLRARNLSRMLSSGLFLSAVAISGIGLSSSALVFLPFLAIVLAIAAFAAGWPRAREVSGLCGYFATLAYPAAGIVYTYRYAFGTVGVESIANRWFPTTFARHLLLWIDPRRPAALMASVTMCFTAIFLLRGAERRFLFTWFAAATLLFLNPLVCPFLIRYATSPNIYWRLFYLYPVTPAIGLVAATLFARLSEGPYRTWRVAACCGAGIALAAAHFIPGAPSTFRYEGERLGWPGGDKLPPGIAECAREIVSVVPAGPMLAPADIAGPIPMFSSNYPQYRVQDGVLLWLGEERGQMREAVQRTDASDFAATGQPALRAAFDQLIASHPDAADLRSVILSDEVARAPGIDDGLRADGFRYRRRLACETQARWAYWR